MVHSRLTSKSLSIVLVFICVATVSGGSSWAETPDKSESVGANNPQFAHVRSQIESLMLKDQLPSVAVAVAQHGKIVWEQGFGWADREQLRPATSDTLYSLASISKPFTATAIMALVKQGKIRLEAPANDYLGAAKITGLAGDASGVTVYRLLNHTSGLPLHWQFFYTNEDYPLPPMDDTILRYGNAVNPPGEVYQYSNLGFGILGYMVSRVSDMSYADAMRMLIFTPLGLTHTSAGIGPGLDRYAAARYDSKMRPLPFYTFDHLGASAVYSSAHDLVRFAMFHLKDQLPDQQQILDNEAIDLMHRAATPMDNPGKFYALGFVRTTDEYGFMSIGHGGGMPGVRTIMRIYPTEDLAVVVLTNCSPADVPGEKDAITQIEEDIVAALVPSYADTRRAKPNNPEQPHEPYSLRPELLGTWSGTVRTWQSTLPLKLVFQPDGDIHVKIADQLETLLDKPHWRGKMLVGQFPGFIPTPDANRLRHYVHLELWSRNGMLQGEANAEAAGDEREPYSLSSYVELKRAAP